VSAAPLKIEAQITKLYKNNHFALFFAIFKIVLSENTYKQKISSQCSLSFPKYMKQESKITVI
jgi:hypothetical protein